LPTSPKKPVDCSELAASLAELALAHGEAGAKTLDDVVAAMRRDLPEVSRDEIADAIVAYSRRNAPAQAMSKDEIKARIADLKRTARRDAELRGQIESLRKRAASEKVPKEKKAQDERIAGLEAERTELQKEGKIEDQIADLKKQLETGNIKMPEPRAKRVLTERMEQLVYERDRAKSEVRKEILKRKPKGIFETLVGEPFDEVRAWWTTGEFSGVGRQGGFDAMGHPVEAAKTIGPMMKAFNNPAYAHKFDMSIRPGNENSRPRAMEYEKAGLHLPDPEIASTRKMSEEAFQSDLPVTRAISKITHIPLDKVPEKFGRAYISYLNMRRVMRYDALAETLTPNGEPTAKEAKAIASFINAATGRGNLGEFKAAVKALNATFFAPRYVISRFEMLLEPIRALIAQGVNPVTRQINKRTGKNIAEMEPHMWGGSLETDKLIAKEYARYAAGVATLIAIASQIPGVEIEYDPHSTDFGKIRIGDTRLDMLSGFQQAIVFMAKQSPAFMGGRRSKSNRTGETEELDWRGWGGNFANFARGKASPMVGTAVDLMLGEDMVGNPVNPTRSTKDAAMYALKMMTPITYRDVGKIMISDMGIPDKAALTTMAMLGAGVQSYDPLMPKAPSDELTVPKEERDLDPDLPSKVSLTPDEYDLLLKAHERAVKAIVKERKKPYFAKLSKKEQAAEIEALYRDEYEVEKDDIVLNAVDRLGREKRKNP
jgi:hypothetical protein